MNVYDYTARRRMRKVLSALVCSAALGSVPAIIDATPAQASTAPAPSAYDCGDAPARFFQLRDGNATDGYSQLWSASVTGPESANPTFYDWKPIHTFTGVKPVALAARDIKKSTNTVSPGWVSYVYFSGTDKNLHQFRWAPNEGTEWRQDQLTTSNLWGYKALAWNGRLWGVKGDTSTYEGDLYVATGLDNYEDDPYDTPSGQYVVKNNFGYPKSFYGVTGGNHQIGFANTAGELKYATTLGGYQTSTVRASSWNAGRTVDLGGGLLYRFLGGTTNEVKRYTLGAIEGSNTGMGTGVVIKSGVASDDAPTTTVSDLCQVSTAPTTEPVAASCSAVTASVPIEHTTLVSGPTGYSFRVHKCLAPSLDRLLDAAYSSGHILKGWGFRSYDSQVQLRKEHCGTSYYAIYEMPSSQCSPPTARPGSSMHERGLAIDFTSNGDPLNTSDFNWLAANADSYGMFNFPKERWHWSTNGN
ncbi:M15 family metallopeptidase [Nocardioides humilatus]|nr:M15 family metallopeptidase [Nocardioides humilatus]